MQRYLQWERLNELGLGHFDAWASQFGDTVTALEMKPTGDGFREYTRFAKFVTCRNCCGCSAKWRICVPM